MGDDVKNWDGVHCLMCDKKLTDKDEAPMFCNECLENNHELGAW